MNFWTGYIRESFFLPTLIVLVAGISLSGIFLNGHSLSLLPSLLSFIGIFLLFVLLRLIDDVKNYEKDCVAYPEKPLPRGLIHISAAKKMIERMHIILFAYSIIIWVIIQETAGLAYAFAAAYSLIKYNDFFAKQWMLKHPLSHGILLQMFIFPIAVFSVSVNNPYALVSPSTWIFAAMLFGAFFCFEISRKLDPHTHPAIGSYVHFYGFHRTYEIATLTLIISAMSGTMLGLSLLLFPCQLVVLFTLSSLFFQPKWFKIPEVCAGLSLMLHAWAIVLYKFIG